MSHPLSTLAFLGVAGFALAQVSRIHRERMAARAEAPPEPIGRWEGEGGGVQVDEHHTAASRVEPEPLERNDDGLAPLGSDPALRPGP